MAVILHSNLETDLRLAAALDRGLHELLADRASIRNTAALMFMGLVNGTGSDTSRIRLVGVDGYDPMVTTAAENTDVANTSLTDGSVDIAVVRGSLRRDMSDLALLTGFEEGDIDPMRLADGMVGSFEAWFMGLVCDAVAAASTTVGSSGVNMSHDDAVDAIYTLELASCPGPYFGLLHPRQVADWQESLRGEGGVMQFQDATAEMLKIKGQGYLGSFLGVDWFKDSRVTASGGNRHGAVWGQGAVAYKFGVPRPIIAGGAVEQRYGDAPILVEFQRDGSAATTEVIGHGYAGVVILEQGRIVGIDTDE